MSGVMGAGQSGRYGPATKSMPNKEPGPIQVIKKGGPSPGPIPTGGASFSMGGGFGGFGGGGGGGGGWMPSVLGGPSRSFSSSSGGGGGSFTPVSYTPTPFNTNVQENPQIAALQAQMAQYRGGLASGNDADAQLAMGRQRDLASGMAKEGLQGALDRGFSGDSGYAQQRRLKGLDAGQSAAAGLNASMASDARKQQLGALQNEGNLAVSQAGVTLGQQNYNLNQWTAQNSAALAAAQLQAQQQQNQFGNQMQLANFYTGF